MADLFATQPRSQAPSDSTKKSAAPRPRPATESHKPAPDSPETIEVPVVKPKVTDRQALREAVDKEALERRENRDMWRGAVSEYRLAETRHDRISARAQGATLDAADKAFLASSRKLINQSEQISLRGQNDCSLDLINTEQNFARGSLRTAEDVINHPKKYTPSYRGQVIPKLKSDLEKVIVQTARSTMAYNVCDASIAAAKAVKDSSNTRVATPPDSSK